MEQEDFKELLERHRDRIYTVAFYSLKNREDAEDVTQDVFIRLWKNRRKLDPERLGAWLMKVTKNACIDAARHRASRGRVDGDGGENGLDRAPDGRADPERRTHASDVRRQLGQALRDLPEPYRSIVILREIRGLAYDDIAAAVGKPLNTVKVYLHRGRKMLRDELREVNAYAQAS